MDDNPNASSASDPCRKDPEQVRNIPIDKLNPRDTTFQYRLFPTPTQLLESIRTDGILVPIIARPHPIRPDEYQIVCGFRRVNAARRIGLSEVPVIVRTLAVDRAWVTAFTENHHRKDIGDLDRAVAMAKFRETGKTTAEVARAFNLSDRQIQYIEAILGYPAELRSALADPTSGVTTTHAIVLSRAAKKNGRAFVLAEWLEFIRNDRPGVKDLKAEISSHFRAERGSGTVAVKAGKEVWFNLGAIDGAHAEAVRYALGLAEEIVSRLKRSLPPKSISGGAQPRCDDNPVNARQP